MPKKITSIAKGLMVGMDEAEVGALLRQLRGYFPEAQCPLIPSTISDRGQLVKLMSISRSLAALEACEGFAEHLDQYRSCTDSAFFVSLVAASFARKVDKLALEPQIKGKPNRGDVKLTLGGYEIYVECKCPELRWSEDYFKEHRHAFDVLVPYVEHPHQVSITFHRRFSDDELHSLGQSLRVLLPQVRSDGRIMNNADLEVQVIWHEQFLNADLRGHLVMLLESINTGEVHPCHHFYENGRKVSIAGPSVNFTKMIVKYLRTSADQAPLETPYVLALSSNLFMGSLAANIGAVGRQFQPARNTRFSAVAFVKHNWHWTEPTVAPEFTLITNAYSKHPLSKQAERLFKA